MSTTKAELIEWLENFNDTDSFGIDDGGLTIRPVDYQVAYLEIGGLPDDDETDDDLERSTEALRELIEGVRE